MATQYMYAPSHSYGHQGIQAHDSSGQNGSFSFKKRFEHIDWRKIASIDIDQISRTLDFNALQENIMNLTFCNIESELDMRMVDPNFVKLFKLAQFTIEYLLHSQDYLAGVVAASEEKVKATEQEMLKLKNEMEKQKEELIEIKKESHKRKKLLIAQQQMIHSGSDSYNKCPFCAKAFLNSSFLQAHIFRRHHEYSSKGSSPEAHGSSGGTISKTLEIELHEIKERLQMTEAALKEEKRANRSLRNSLKDGDHNISSEVYQERLQYEEQQREMEEMRHKYEKEIQDLNLKQQATERALIDMRHGRRSNIGNLEDDDDEMDPRVVNKQSKEVLELQEQLHVMRNQMDKQNKKWSKKINEMSDTRNQLMNALEKTDKELLASKKIQSPEKDQQHTQNEDILRKRQPKKSREQEQLLSMLEEEMERDAEKNRLIEAKKREERQRKEERERKEERHRTVKTKNETVVETIVNKRTRTQGLKASPSQQVRRSASPARMEPSDDEDESEMLTGTGTGSFLTSQKGTGTLQSTGGSNINRTLNTGDYLKHLRTNPTLDLLKKEFLAQLDEKLEKIGVDPKQPGITDFVCDNKLAMLKTQRHSYEKKYADFLRLRDKLDRDATIAAKNRYKEMKRSPPSSPQGTYHSLNGSRQGSPYNTGQRQTFPQAAHSSGPSPRPRGTDRQPVPTPRSAKTLQSTGSTTEWTSTQWDSDESFEESEMNSRRRQHEYASPRQLPPSAAPRLIQSQPLTNNNNLDNSWDSDSESLPQQPVQPRIIISKPKGESVSRLSQSIEYQLNNRNVKKPVGGVNTFKSDGVFDDESDWGSEEEEKKPAVQRRPPTRTSHGDTEYSTNTYNSSQWGTSSKGASTVHQETKRSGSKSSFVSVTDVSSDDDLDTENI